MNFDPETGVIFAGGAWQDPGPAPRFAITDPATLEHVGRVADCGPEIVDRVVAEANAAQKGWAALDAKSRATALHRVADSIEQTPFDAVAEQMVRDMGKPFPEATGELANVAPVFRYMAEMARDEAGKIAGTTEAGSFQFARYEPYGVTVHIEPYNFPILLMAWSVAASLAAGNAVIVKPAEVTSLTTLRFMAHFASLPPGLVSCVTGGPATGAALVEHSGTHAVTVTGSAATGSCVAEACGRLLKPCTVEAGGNDAFIVMPSAPVDVAAAGAVTAAFHLTGQVCTSAERFYVHDAIYEPFLEAFTKGAQQLRIGTGFDRAELGPLVSEAARDKVARIVADALEKGAELVTGGRVPPGRNTGWFFEPTILTGVTPEMAISREEVFGPVAAVCRVSDLDEAIARTNDSRFGLGASIFTHDLDEAMRASAEIRAGLVWVNNPLIDNDALPFGGWGLSGLGRSLSRLGLDAFRQSRMVVMDPKAVTKEWWYPYPDDWFWNSGKPRFAAPE